MKELRYYIKALYLSLFSRKFYSDLIAARKIFGIRYLLLLSVFVATPVAIEVKYIIANFFTSNTVDTDENIDYITKQLPDIVVENGEISTFARSNQSIVSRSGNVIAIFDVENKINDLNGYDKVLIINKQGMRFRLDGESGVAIIMASDIENALEQYLEQTPQGSKFNTAQFFSDVKHILRTPLLVIILFATIWFFAKYLFSTTAYSFVVGILLSFLCKDAKFDFKQCFRVAAFTSTPIALMEMFSNMTGGGLFSYASLVYFITHMIYIHFAVDSYKKVKVG